MPTLCLRVTLPLPQSFPQYRQGPVGPGPPERRGPGPPIRQPSRAGGGGAMGDTSSATARSSRRRVATAPATTRPCGGRRRVASTRRTRQRRGSIPASPFASPGAYSPTSPAHTYTSARARTRTRTRTSSATARSSPSPPANLKGASGERRPSRGCVAMATASRAGAARSGPWSRRVAGWFPCARARACVRACLRAGARARVLASLRACVRVCVRVRARPRLCARVHGVRECALLVTIALRALACPRMCVRARPRACASGGVCVCALVRRRVPKAPATAGGRDLEGGRNDVAGLRQLRDLPPRGPGRRGRSRPRPSRRPRRPRRRPTRRRGT